MLSRTVVPVVRNRVLARSFHASTPARSAHGDSSHIPVPFSVNKSKAAFGTKVFVFLACGFLTPFSAAAWQLSKGSA